MKEHVMLGHWTEDSLDTLLQKSPPMDDISSRIAFLSRQFLGIPYKESTLIGDERQHEVFVINLAGLDCFTLLDYIEALRVSRTFSEFKDHLVSIRYQQGDIAYEKRNHFFTDWKAFNAQHVDDITERIAEGVHGKSMKTLNERDDGSHFLYGIPCREREVLYIPINRIDNDLILRLQTGDYIGIYSAQKGLDVSHVGIFIRNEHGVFLRHASQVRGKVVDESLSPYISDKPGIVVLRPKELQA